MIEAFEFGEDIPQHPLHPILHLEIALAVDIG